MDKTVLSFEQVSKSYGAREVIGNVTFPLRRGECAAITGINGSGKTTLLKLAAGLTRPSSGAVRKDGGIAAQYVPESFPRLNISAAQLLRSLGRAEGLGKTEGGRRTDRLLGLFNLSPAANAPLRAYSKGMLQKISLIQAFQGRADVLLLDEPLSGQDSESQETFISLCKEVLKEGKAMLLACHEQGLIHTLADTAYEIRGGALHAGFIPIDRGEDIYRFEPPGEGFLFPPDIKGVFKVEHDGGVLLVAVPHGEGDGMLLQMLRAGCRLRGMRHEKNR